MNMPGFHAIASLYKASTYYCITNGRTSVAGSDFSPWSPTPQAGIQLASEILSMIDLVAGVPRVGFSKGCGPCYWEDGSCVRVCGVCPYGPKNLLEGLGGCQFSTEPCPTSLCPSCTPSCGSCQKSCVDAYCNKVMAPCNAAPLQPYSWCTSCSSNGTQTCYFYDESGTLSTYTSEPGTCASCSPCIKGMETCCFPDSLGEIECGLPQPCTPPQCTPHCECQQTCVDANCNETTLPCMTAPSCETYFGSEAVEPLLLHAP